MKKMKNYIHIKILAVVVLLFTGAACETDFDNPNAATDEQTYSSREGTIAAAIGMQQLYSTAGLRWIVETPAITTREVGITTTFQNMIELEDGGSELPNSNSNVEGMWGTLYRVVKVAEDLENNVPNLGLQAGTESGLLAFAKLFKAMSIGALSQNYTDVVIETDQDNNAEFVSRMQGYQEAIRLLNEANSLISANPVSDEFNSAITLGNIDLQNTINAMLARFNLFAGNYDAAISAASSVDPSSTSFFNYDTQNLNPIWSRVYQNSAPNWKPRDEFGLPEYLQPEEDDMRKEFYLIPLDTLNQNGLPIEDLAGFYDVSTEPIPIYLPDEMDLIIAEANLRKSSPDTDAAVNALNDVLTDSSDPLNVNAGLDAYSGVETVDALLDAIYTNRRAELFLTGVSLEDSRRFNRPEPSGQSRNFAEERNRNFYPFPESERNSNPNTPQDPSI